MPPSYGPFFALYLFFILPALSRLPLPVSRRSYWLVVWSFPLWCVACAPVMVLLRWMEERWARGEVLS
jgi:hypothetical protein